jgi:hypothetical protein
MTCKVVRLIDRDRLVLLHVGTAEALKPWPDTKHEFFRSMRSRVTFTIRSARGESCSAIDFSVTVPLVFGS